MDGELITRTATIDDAVAIQRLLRVAMLTYCAESDISTSMLEAMTESIESVEERIRNNNCIAVFDGNSAVGTITVGITNVPVRYSFSSKTESFLSGFSQAAYISRFAVIQGLRHGGLGQSLISAGEKYANESGCEVMLLHCSTMNKKMTAFYEARGFKLMDAEKSRGYPRGLFAKTL